MATLEEIDAKLIETGETQISLTDPDSRLMMTRGSGIVGYNVQDRRRRQASFDR